MPLLSQVSAAGLGSKSAVPLNAPESCTLPSGVTLKPCTWLRPVLPPSGTAQRKSPRCGKTEDVGRFIGRRRDEFVDAGTRIEIGRLARPAQSAERAAEIDVAVRISVDLRSKRFPRTAELSRPSERGIAVELDRQAVGVTANPMSKERLPLPGSKSTVPVKYPLSDDRSVAGNIDISKRGRSSSLPSHRPRRSCRPN